MRIVFMSQSCSPPVFRFVYRLKEGATLVAMAADANSGTKIGDGRRWTPTLSVTGGTSGFYTIQVAKWLDARFLYKRDKESAPRTKAQTLTFS